MNDPRPIETSDPIPAAASKAAFSTMGSRGPSISAASMRRIAATSGESKIRAITAKVPEAAITSVTSEGSSLRYKPHGQDAQTAAEGNQRCLRAEHDSEPDGRDRGQHDPGQLDRLYADAGVFKPSAGMWPPRPGSRTIAKATISPAIARTGNPPPQRGAVLVTQLSRQVVPHPLLGR